MTDSTEPLDRATLDELVSADLDGELALAASDLGLTLDDARVALASPEALARRRAQERARESVGGPVSLDPAEADRLVAAARAARDADEVAAARSRRAPRTQAFRRSVLVATSAAAVIAGIVLLVGHSTTGGPKASSSAVLSPERAAAPPTAANSPADFGDVSNVQSLQSRVRASLGSRTPRPLETDAAKANGANAKRAASFGTADRIPAALSSCAPTLQHALGSAPEPALSGHGVDRGRAVYVLVFPRGSGYAVFVVDPDGCRIVSRTTVH